MSNQRKSGFYLSVDESGEFRALCVVVERDLTRSVVLPVSTRRAAIALATRLHCQLARVGSLEGFFGRRDKARLTLANCLYQWIGYMYRDRGHSGEKPVDWATAKRYRDHIRPVFDHCGWRMPADVSAESFMAWAGKLQISEKAFVARRRELCAFLDDLVLNGIMRSNPLRFVGREETQEDAKSLEAVGTTVAASGQFPDIAQSASCSVRSAESESAANCNGAVGSPGNT